MMFDLNRHYSSVDKLLHTVATIHAAMKSSMIVSPLFTALDEMLGRLSFLLAGTQLPQRLAAPVGGNILCD